MYFDQKIWLGTGDDQQPVFLLPQMANRHGLIAGATGTGKTVSLKVMAEGFSDMGVPVFLSDVKGDLSGMVKPGEMSDRITERLMKTGVSEMTPRPILPENFPKSFSKRERNGAFCMLCMARWNTFPFSTAMPPRCVPRCE